MARQLSLGVLDQSPIARGRSGADALADTLDLARRADALGYSRYWVAEHHGGPMLAGAAPEALVGPIAMAAPHLRVGTGGVMLPHYSPFKVAETWSVLAGLFPDRIDLGLGRAAGTDGLTTFALQRDRSRQLQADDFPAQLQELLWYLDGRTPADHPFKRLEDLPGGAAPEPWLLGSSPQSGIWAAELGLPYAFADFINPNGASIAQSYLSEFSPVRGEEVPQVLPAVWVLVADTDEEAQFLAGSSAMAMVMLRQGRLIAVPPPEEAERFLERTGQRPKGRRAVVGSPATVKAGLEEVAEAYGAHELLAVTITYDHAARVRSYELLAEAFGLEARAEAPVAAAA